MNKHDKQYIKLYDDTLTNIEGIYDDAIKSLSAAITTIAITTEKRFLFKDYPALNKLVNKNVKLTGNKVIITIQNTVAKAWRIANDKNDELVTSKFKGTGIEPKKAYLVRNEEALKAFQVRKVKGLKVSNRVWLYTDELKDQLEQAIDAALTKGSSAAQLGRDIKQYLKYPDKRFRRIRDKWGNLKPSYNAMQYHPGQGVYRSATQNAQRLARTEINKAYRTADYLRWQKMDMVVGYRIRPSERFYTAVCSICQALAGIYPKNFNFTGWHVSCRCTAIPIMCSDADFEKLLAGKDVDLKQPDMPKKFMNWYEENKGKLKENSLPAWFKDNKGLLKAG